jgi:hypothetical protein
MFTAVVLLYRLRVHVVRADAAYFNYAFLDFIRNTLRASVNVDYNLRRKGKRFLADLFFLRQWRDLMTPRANIERHFAWTPVATLLRSEVLPCSGLSGRLSIRIPCLHRCVDRRLHRRTLSAARTGDFTSKGASFC